MARVSLVSTAARAAPVVAVETAEPVALAVPDQTMDEMAMVVTVVTPATPVMAQMAVTVSMR